MKLARQKYVYNNNHHHHPSHESRTPQLKIKTSAKQISEFLLRQQIQHAHKLY